MFLRIVRARSGGEIREYIRLVETYRKGGRVKQRVVQTLGRKDRLASHLDALIRLLRPDHGGETEEAQELRAHAALTWGPVVVARQLWEALDLDTIIRRCCRSRQGRELSDRAFVLVCSRLCAPGSEHALAWWLEEAYVTDSRGRRYLPVWKQRGRVQVDPGQLAQWYRTLDALVEGKETIEHEVYLGLRDLFSLEVDVVFYDLTSTYFEGRGPVPLAQHGYSRDGHPRERQVQVGVVMASGWPIAHHVFGGKIKDHQTVREVMEDLHRRFAVKQVVFVGDRGMVTRETMGWLREEEIPYIVALRRRRNPRVQAMLRRIRSVEPIRWEDLLIYEFKGEEEERVLIVKSPERLTYERGMRRAVMKRVWPKLQALARRVREGRLRDKAAIGAAAQRIMAESHAYRYFFWKLTPEGALQVGVDREKLRVEIEVEGTYVIATDQKDLTPLQVVNAYKELAGVERVFRESKDLLEMRPIYHRTEQRVEAHLFVVALSFLLYQALENKLKKAGVRLSARQALRALESVRLVDLEAQGQRKWLVTRPNQHARAVLKAVGLGDLQVPTSSQETVL